jgi:hypothetical protein
MITAQTQILFKTMVSDYQMLALHLKSESAAYKAFYVESRPEIIYIASYHCDAPFFETAVVKLSDDINAPHTLIESLTIGWIKPDELVTYLVDAANSQVNYGQINLAFDKEAANNITANFTCGCCGEWFSDNIVEQAKFDQDSGYGICENCKEYYS